MTIAPQTFQWICIGWIALALIVHVAMFFVTAPFGRHTNTRWGISINNKLGWVIMELPSLSIMVWFFSQSTSQHTYSWVLFALWIFHYTNRVFIYPFRIKPTPKKMPLLIVGMAIVFNLVNAGLNGYFLTHLSAVGQYDASWITSLPFLTGLALFATGLFTNWKSDNILIHLRKRGETGYVVPRGFLFELVSSPNLLGEIIEWSGFALMAQNLPALSFMIWTFANLVPRAKNHHDWYLRNFPDYPENRKVIFPFLF